MTHKISASVVICDEETYAAAEREFNFIPNTPILVKGTDTPLAVWECRNEIKWRHEDVKSSTKGLMIGYENERNTLQELISTFQISPPCPCFSNYEIQISGEIMSHTANAIVVEGKPGCG